MVSFVWSARGRCVRFCLLLLSPNLRLEWKADVRSGFGSDGVVFFTAFYIAFLHERSGCGFLRLLLRWCWGNGDT